MKDAVIFARSTPKSKFGTCEPGGHEPAWPFIIQCPTCAVTYCRRHPHECKGAVTAENCGCPDLHACPHDIPEGR